MNTETWKSQGMYSGSRKKPPPKRYGRMAAALRRPTGRVLDIGCWDSGFLDRLPGSSTKYGIDYHPRRLDGKIAFVRGDVSRGLPFRSGAFNTVGAGEIIEHLLNPDGFIEEIRRVLKPGGQVVLSTPNLCFWRNVIQIVRGKSLFWVDFRSGQNGHVRYFAPDSLRQILEENGLVVLDLFSFDDVTGRGRISRLIGRVLAGILRRHGMTLLAVAQKPQGNGDFRKR